MKLLVTVKLFVLGLVVGCASGVENQGDSCQDDIVILDISGYSRADLGGEIRRLAEYDAKVIALAVVLFENQNNVGDSILATAIETAGNVVLMAGMDDAGNIINPNMKFLVGSMGAGVPAYLFNEEGYCDEYVSLYEHHVQIEHFANLVAFHYRQTARNSFDSIRVNESYQMPLLNNRGFFQELNRDYVQPDVMGRIVLLGILDESDKMKVKIDGALIDAPQSIVTASVICDLIKD